MKKLLIILVLGLLVCNNAFANQIKLSKCLYTKSDARAGFKKMEKKSKEDPDYLKNGC